MIGKIKFYSIKNDYGFIIGEDGREYYFHRKAILNKENILNLKSDTKVKFNIIEGSKGKKADGVVLYETTD